MIQEEKELLLKDICARLPYGLVCKVEFKDSEGWKKQNMLLEGVFTYECYFESKTGSIYSKEFKPYLRPMSSITEEELNELEDISCLTLYPNGTQIPNGKDYDWLNAHHFDYRGLIEKGLALEAPEGMYK